MANTQISLQLSDGVIVPSQGSVPVKEGDTVTFVNPGTGPALLFFSPGTRGALSPTPSASTTIQPGTESEFSFTTSDSGAYSVFCGIAGSTVPVVFPTDHSTSLSLQVASSGVSFGGVVINTNSGS